MSSLWVILCLLVLIALLLLWLVGGPWRVALRRQRLRAQPFPAAWREILRQRVPYFRQLPVDLQLQLKKHIQVFIAEKPFIGCAGLQITDEIRVTIAAQACLLILNRRSGYYPQLRQILVYPAAFWVDQVRSGSDGVVQEQRQARSGESWAQGQVVLSWHDTVHDATLSDMGHNVVIHEFAHQLDQENGAANGAPPLRGGTARVQRWTQVFSAAFAQLQQNLARGETSVLDGYGATNPAEFFAVASEVFFGQARQLSEEQPALYAELCDFYRVDPLSW